jgi:hypothetical protein
MLSAQHIVAHTPTWVFLVLAYLVWQGVESLRPRTVPLWRVLVAPGLFIVSGLSRILGDTAAGLGGLMPWVIAFIVFMPLAFVTGPRLLAVNRRRGEVTRPGGSLTLLRNMVVFFLQFTAAVLSKAGGPGGQLAALAAPVISGATAGYFIGWVIVALRHYSTAPDGPATLPAHAPDRGPSSRRPWRNRF